MPNPTRPNVVPIWTQGNNSARQQPTNGEQFTGFVPDFRPPAGWHNFLFGIMSDWIEFLNFATEDGNLPVGNVGHNILTGITLQDQLDECDAFLSSLGLKPIPVSPTGNPAVFTMSEAPVNSSVPIVFKDGEEQKSGTDYTYAVILGVPTITYGAAPDPAEVTTAFALTANQPGAGGSSMTGGFVVYGSTISPLVITAAGGVTSTSDQRALMFLVSSGGQVNITANPQISAGTKVGQELRLVGTSDTNYITMQDGNGLSLNGPISLKNHQVIDLWWDGSVWVEDARR